MAADEIILTPAGRKELEDELYRREHELHDEIGEQLRVARAFGDLSENAEYDAAREAQARNESRITEIRHILATARVVDPTSMGKVVAVGTEVELEDKGGHRISFALVGTTETDSLAHRISNESPAGAALVGHVVGDEVSFVTPAGKLREYTIVDIRLPKVGGASE
jgi:transcription elongation factor GreA